MRLRLQLTELFSFRHMLIIFYKLIQCQKILQYYNTTFLQNFLKCEDLLMSLPPCITVNESLLSFRLLVEQIKQFSDINLSSGKL